MIPKILLISLCFCSFPALADDTVLKFYRPFGDATEQVLPIVKNEVIGECDTQSQLILREDAWRCRAMGKIFDPCFVKLAGKNKAICPQSPWVADSVQINVSNSLNNENHVALDMSRVFPWAIELENGERCQAIDSQDVFDAMPVRYRCSNKNVLIGYLQRCKSVWSMLEKTPDGVETVNISKAWF